MNSDRMLIRYRSRMGLGRPEWSDREWLVRLHAVEAHDEGRGATCRDRPSIHGEHPANRNDLGGRNRYGGELASRSGAAQKRMIHSPIT